MRIMETKIYQYDELSDKAKEKARDWFREASSGDEWWESTYEDAENVGIKISGFDINRGNYCKGKFISGAEETAWKIEKEHGETCETFKTAKAFLKERDRIVDEAPKDENREFESERELDAALNECESDFLRSILEDYRILLQKQYEYVNSDECVEETIRANEYEFEESGKCA
jgi:hypothetical protein